MESEGGKKCWVFLGVEETIVSSLVLLWCAYCSVSFQYVVLRHLVHSSATPKCSVVLSAKKNEKPTMTRLFLITELTKCVQQRIKEIIWERFSLYLMLF